MEASTKKRWLEALRSGKYEQISHDLAVGDTGRCCLGVLLDICGETKTEIILSLSHKKCSEDGPIRVYQYLSASDVTEPYAMPSKQFGVKVGLSEEEMRHLASMNDDGFSFNEIADYIEEKH